MSVDSKLNDIPVLSGDLDIPLSWEWTSDATLDGDATPPSEGDEAIFEILGFQRIGVIERVDRPYGRTVVRVRGGAGKLGVVLEPRDYYSISMRDVVADCLRDAGEEIGDLDLLKDLVLPHWIRAAEPAGRAIRRVLREGPPEAVIQANISGAFDVFVPDWSTTWILENEDIAERLIADGAIVVYPPEQSSNTLPLAGGSLIPGASVMLPLPDGSGPDPNGLRKIDRVQYQLATRLRATLWIRQ